MVSGGSSRIPRAFSFLTNAVAKRNGDAQTLRESEERFRNVLGVSRDLIYKLNLVTGSFDYVSPSVLPLTGFSPEEFAGLGLKGVANRFHPETRGRVLAAFDNLPHPEIEAGEVPEVEYRWKRKDGRYRWFRDSRTLMHDEQGRAISIVSVVCDVTERKQMEEALRTSEELMRKTLDSTTDGILVVDTSANVLHANARFAEIWDMPQELIEAGNTEPMRRFAADQLEDPDGFVSRITELYRSLDPSFDTVTFKDGRVFERYSSPLMREEEMIGRVWSYRDVTEREQAEAFLAEQTRALGALLRGAPLGEVLTTIVKMIEERAQGMLCSILLFNKEEGLLRPGAAPSLPDSFNQATAQGIPIGPKAGSCGTAAYRAEPVISSDIASDPIWAEYKALAISNELRACWSTPIFSSEREVLGTFAMYYHEPRSPGEAELRLIELATGFVGIAIERKQAEETLEASEERFRHLYTASPAMLHSIDREGRIVSVSDRWLEVLGYERSEVIGRKSVEFLTEESRRYAEEVSLPDFWKRGVARDIRNQFVRKDGEIVDILLSAIAERDKEGNPYRTLSVLTDITEQKRLEEQLLSAREELEGKVERQMLRKNPYGLTFRELTILHLLVAGRSDKEIATELVISPQTVHKHVSNILGKMDAASRTEAATRALREGLLD